MTYQGYMALANDEGETIELVNAARVKAYTDNLAPSLGLRGCDDCEGLDEALGETYVDPVTDNAPWYDPTDPATADFYGVYPLAFEGIDDSTRSIESAELSGDGSVVVGSRFTGKDIRVSGMAFAKDEAALYAGVSWLDSALNGTEEGRCFGDRLDLYSSCPPVQVLPPDFAQPYTLEVPPDAAELAAWTTTSGTILSDPDGVRFDWLTGDPQKIACREITGLVPGEQYQLRARIANFGNYYVRIGSTCAGQRINLARNPRVMGWPFSGAGISDTESDVPDGGPLGLGWRRSITTSTNSSSPYSAVAPDDEEIPVLPGQLYQGSIYVIGETSTARFNAAFYDNMGVQIGSDHVFQTGLSMTGVWQRLSGVVTAPAGAATMRLRVRWSAGVGDIATNTTFGIANLLIERPNFDILRTNLQQDPRAQSSTANWGLVAGTGGVATSVFVTGAVDGPTLYGTTAATTYRRVTITTAPTGGSAGITARRMTALDYPNPIPAGTPWATGAWFRSNRTVSGTAEHRLLNTGGTVMQIISEPFTLTANVWQFISASGVTPGALSNVETIGTRLLVGGVGGGAAVLVGDIYSATGSLITVGSGSEVYFDEQRPSSAGLAYAPITLPSSLDGSMEVDVADVGSYFDGFTDGFEWDGLPNDSTSSTDEGIDYQTIAGWSQDPPTEPTVLDFIPRTESVFLSISPTQQHTAVLTDLLLIEEALVRRVPRPSVMAFGAGNDAVPPSDGWTHLAPATAEVNWIIGDAVENDLVRTDMRAPFGSALTYTTAHGIERTVFGLIPNSRYRLMIEFNAGWAATDADPIIPFTPIVAIGNSTGAVATYAVDSSMAHFWVIEFTATATSSEIFFHPNSNLSLGSFGLVNWSVDQYMVEEILETDATPPQPGRFQERTMYEVKASQGPILTNVRTSPCGVMGQISYSIRAGNPFKYRQPIFAGGLPAGTSTEVEDIVCSADGLAQITNYSYNPSVETNGTDWSTVGLGDEAGARTASATARVGGFVWRSTASNSVGNRVQYALAYYDVASVTDGPIPQPGETLTASIYYRVTNSLFLGIYEWNIRFAMDGFTNVNFAGTHTATAINTWYRIEQTFTLPLNVPLELIEIAVFTPDLITQGGGFDLDGVMIQRGSVATEPFDETTEGVAWSATPNTSALILTPTLEDISEDPDCPAPPAPPAPPPIDDECITEPATYNRTVVEISADTVPRNLTAYPVITLTAGSAPVRQARIRFWPNPDNLTIDLLDPCSYDGEIIVSYLADGATMVIDGVLREATVSKPGFVDVNANHALYGPEGGPVDWPELSGGIPYLVTLELDSTQPYTDTLMTIDLVVRD